MIIHSKKEWTAKEIEDWREAVDDIQQHWCAETKQDAFPKLHMLKHSLELAEKGQEDLRKHNDVLLSQLEQCNIKEKA